MDFAGADRLTPPVASSPAWLTPLLEAATPRAVAVTIAGMMHSLPGCRDVRVVWGLDAADGPSSEPADPLATAGAAVEFDLDCNVLSDERLRLAKG